MVGFLKSKKGFTLVELMIVVVIMAILVAVAVPIYSAVTRNARIKTCAGNRREIVSQVNIYLMGSIDGAQHNVTADETIYIVSDGEKGWIAEAADATAETTSTDALLAGANLATIKNLFQTLPYCPSGDADALIAYTVTVKTGAFTGDDVDTTANIVVSCGYQTTNEKHV